MKTNSITLILTIIMASITVIVGIFANLVMYSVITPQPFNTSMIYGLLIILSIITLALAVLQILPRLPLLWSTKSSQQEYPIKITLELEGTPITIETFDPERAEDIMKLAKRIMRPPSLAIDKTPQGIIKESEGTYRTGDSSE